MRIGTFLPLLALAVAGQALAQPVAGNAGAALGPSRSAPAAMLARRGGIGDQPVEDFYGSTSSGSEGGHSSRRERTEAARTEAARTGEAARTSPVTRTRAEKGKMPLDQYYASGNRPPATSRRTRQPPWGPPSLASSRLQTQRPYKWGEPVKLRQTWDGHMTPPPSSSESSDDEPGCRVRCLPPRGKGRSRGTAGGRTHSRG